MSYIQCFYHIVFSTKYRTQAINEDHERLLYKNVLDYCNTRKCRLYRIGGMPDHIHIFVSLPSDISLADFVHDLKLATNTFMKENTDKFPNFVGWGDYYCALTYAKRDCDLIINYIKNQKVHHKSTSSVDELKQLLDENEVDYDERFLK